MADPLDDEPEVWQSVFRFLQRNARLVVDVDQETLQRRPPLQGFLFQTGQVRHVEARPGVTQTFTDPANLPVDDPYTLFLFENQEIPVEDLREQTGLLFLRYDDLGQNWLRLFQHHNIDVGPEANNRFQWAHLQQHGCPLNALVVADKYAYSQFTDDTFEENLGALLLALLPEQISDPVHITLITDLWTAYEQKSISPNEIYDRIEHHLHTARPQLDAKVTVSGYEHGTGHKDRFIITNYALFSSNDSFAFFRNGTLNKETFLHHLPLSVNGSKAQRRLERLAAISSDPPQYPRADRDQPLLLGSGFGINRLLDTVASSS
ncbi:hypothetical protein [Salisaeta longa]|uniref:hypothetical protein n=1 Tax=Salisaeta longa TaxID=503170 RepID=UPI0012FAF39D|nr:hypothetical protein [Salisaeta longa]